MPTRDESAQSMSESVGLAPAPPWDLDESPPMILDHPAPMYAAEPQSSVTVQQASPQPILLAAQSAPVMASLVPIAALNWDGNWPTLAASLPVRGVVQQLALQSELRHCDVSGKEPELRLRVPLETLLSAGSLDQLTVAVSEYFGKTVRIVTEIAAVQHTASAQMNADRLQLAEQAIHSDPFVQTMMREFGATIVQGSIKPH